MLIVGVILLCAMSFFIGWMWRDLECGCRLIRKTHGAGYQPTQQSGGPPPPPPAE